ncbi:MAG: type II secretion system F family protein [Pseudomonadota bacterium]|nr:type II secretion system F family protein [Pseudomonadota bacterium]
MPLYQYKARSPAGHIKTGEMQAKSKAVVRGQLRRMRLAPYSVSEVVEGKQGVSLGLDWFYYRDKKGGVQLRFGYQFPKLRDLSVFSRQFSSMLMSGIPMMKCLEVLHENQGLFDFKKSIQDTITKVEQGQSLSEAINDFPHIYPPLYRSMIKAGEQSGELDKMMRKLSEHLEKTSKIISKTKSALAYPVAVTVLSIAILIGMLVYIVPVFAQQYADAGQELPALTQFVIDVSNAIREHYILITASCIAMVIMTNLYLKTKDGKYRKDKAMLKIPKIGDLIRKTIIARFCYSMSTMLSSGVNMIESLKVSTTGLNNVIVESFLEKVTKKVSEGMELSTCLKERDDIFPIMATSMIEVGERSGSIDTMLEKVAQIYEEEVEEAVKALLALIEPATIVLIGSMVGFIVLALYLPIFDMGNLVGN